MWHHRIKFLHAFTIFLVGGNDPYKCINHIYIFMPEGAVCIGKVDLIGTDKMIKRMNSFSNCTRYFPLPLMRIPLEISFHPAKMYRMSNRTTVRVYWSLFKKKKRKLYLMTYSRSSRTHNSNSVIINQYRYVYYAF